MGPGPRTTQAWQAAVVRAHDGDGSVECSCGQRHWGRFGAAGLLVSHAGRVLLQHRAPWSHHGDTWGVPGGARRSDEDALTAALREAKEEAGVDADVVTPYVSVLDDHGPWSYTTVLARTDHEFTALATDPECECSLPMGFHRRGAPPPRCIPRSE